MKDRMMKVENLGDLYDLAQARNDASLLFNQWASFDEAGSRELIDFISYKGSDFYKFEEYTLNDCIKLFEIFDLTDFKEPK